MGNSISPTAHYTGYVYYRNGLSHRAFVSPTGWFLYQVLRPLNHVYYTSGKTSLEASLLARHTIINHLLTESIKAGRIGQVVEIASGLSPRGWRVTERFKSSGLVYVEGDLPLMVGLKKKALADLGPKKDNHHVVELDALSEDCLSNVRKYLDPNKGTAVITEGLLFYFDWETIFGMFKRFAEFLSTFPRSLFIGDIHTPRKGAGMVDSRMYKLLRSTIASSRINYDYRERHEILNTLSKAGFNNAVLHGGKELSSMLIMDIADDIVSIIDADCEAKSLV
ncbi:MAG: hypothetical protein GY847_41195 [Proteobacteria bacterium]|nr:hypothetical protein [Pseudomonadota bacterium]